MSSWNLLKSEELGEKAEHGSWTYVPQGLAHVNQWTVYIPKTGQLPVSLIQPGKGVQENTQWWWKSEGPTARKTKEVSGPIQAQGLDVLGLF